MPLHQQLPHHLRPEVLPAVSPAQLLLVPLPWAHLRVLPVALEADPLLHRDLLSEVALLPVHLHALERQHRSAVVLRAC
jgi:hypothetical protein